MITNIASVARTAYDFIIVGAGTAGLTLASRLLENSTYSILVLEAGEANLDDPEILLGGRWGYLHGNPKYDWDFATVPQQHCLDRVFHWPQGKGIGGSSSINFYTWSKPPASDIDAWETLGNPGWNWQTYHKFALRAEGFTAASDRELKDYAHTYNNEYRGWSGPVKTTVPIPSLRVNEIFFKTLKELGVPLLDDPYGGNITGYWMAAANFDRNARWTRSYAATAYYLPHNDNPRLMILTEAIAARVLFSDKRFEGNLVATGVEFVHQGTRYNAYANKEVILSAGTMKSPQLLELSGIGRRDVLETIGVDVKLELPGVGENLQDHTFVGLSYELNPSVAHKTSDVFRDPELANEQARLQSLDQVNMHRLAVTGFSYLSLQFTSPGRASYIVDSVEKYIEKQKKGGELPPGLVEQYAVQLRILKDSTLPDMELIAFPGYLTFKTTPANGKSHVSVLCVPQHPLTRGSVHAKSNDPLDQPIVDPHLFEIPQDLDIFVENFKMARRITENKQFNSDVVREVDPGPNTQTDEEIEDYIRRYCNTCFHACGTASMLPHEMNGVVDPQLKVYGTRNLRVCDLSIVPLEIAAHTQATVYAIGEQMADILLECINGIPEKNKYRL